MSGNVLGMRAKVNSYNYSWQLIPYSMKCNSLTI